MSATDLAAVIVTIVCLAVVVVLVLAVQALVRTLRELRRTVDELRANTLPMVDDLHSTVNRASDELDRVDGVIDRAERATATADVASRLAYRAFAPGGFERCRCSPAPAEPAGSSPVRDAVRVRLRSAALAGRAHEENPMKRTFWPWPGTRPVWAPACTCRSGSRRPSNGSPSRSPMSLIAVDEQRARPVMRWSTFARSQRGADGNASREGRSPR